ncbi:hypothetical protein CD790_03840 [Streptomyces sp. SAJ15]|nr:hypothetical protein CD790_03840 [Streptomyces sp. SAJ15]
MARELLATRAAQPTDCPAQGIPDPRVVGGPRTARPKAHRLPGPRAGRPGPPVARPARCRARGAAGPRAHRGGRAGVPGPRPAGEARRGISGTGRVPRPSSRRAR